MEILNLFYPPIIYYIYNIENYNSMLGKNYFDFNVIIQRIELLNKMLLNIAIEKCIHIIILIRFQNY